MSAVLSRKILGDLLERYANIRSRRVTQQIDSFIADTSRPYGVRENLHHLREVADFGAHTITNERQEIIDVDRQEAEWTLDIVDGLIDYFIVTPNRDAEMRAAMDAKIKEAGRTPIARLPDAPPDESDEGE